MIITFSTQKGGAGKTTLAIAFANYVRENTTRKVKVYDFDFQKSFYNKWKEDEEISSLEPIYPVEVVNEEKPFKDIEEIFALHDSQDLNIFDLAGTLDEKYSDLLIYSNYLVIPFEYSDVSVKSTLVFINLLHHLNSEAERIFIRSRYEKGYNYRNQELMDTEISLYGLLLKNPVYKRNCLQKINTRKLTAEQNRAVREPFKEIIEKINENSRTTF